MKCTNCGAEFEGKFCSNCGTPALARGTEHSLIKCANCGTEFEGKFCPNCGESAHINPQPSSKAKKKKEKKVEEKKPIYKRVWFVVLVAIALISAISRISDSIKDNKTEKIVWSNIELGDILPKPKFNKGKIYENSKEELWIEFKKVDDNAFKDYVDACEEKGFTIDAEDSSSSYDAYNKEGYKLHLSCYDSEMTIELQVPVQFSKIQWPESPLVKLLPVPKSLEGKIDNESDTDFSVLIGNTPIDDYNDYVSACIKAGFDVDYSRNDKYFSANNEDGYEINVEYKGFNTMRIDIDAPDLDEQSKEDKEHSNADDELDANGLRPDFKKAMDSYEEFMNEYVNFMNEYKKNPSDLTLLAEYADYMSKYSQFCDDFDEWDDEELNDAETAYYIVVQSRVSQKLLEAAS